MLKKYISVLTVSIAALMCGNIACADVIVDDVNSTITLSGTVESEAPKVNVGIEVLAPGKTKGDISGMNASEFEKIVPYVFQVTSKEGGKWDKSFKLSNYPSGKYTVYVRDENAQSASSENFIFVNYGDGQSAISDLFSAYPNKGGVQNILENKTNDLGLGYDFANELSYSSLAEIVVNEIENGEISNSGFTETLGGMKRAAIINAIDEGAINNLFDYSDILKLDKSSISDFYKTAAVSKNASEITDSLKNGNFTDFESFDGLLAEKTVLAVVANPDGVDDVKNIVSAFSGKIGVNAGITDSICQKIMGRTYSSYAELKRAINDAASSSNGGNGGGGGGSSKSNSSLNGAFPASAPSGTEVKPMEYDIFTDIQDVQWAKDAIVFLAQSGIINGKSEKEFCPNDNITREEIVTIIARAFCKDSEESAIEFTDVPKDSWYYSPIAKAVNCNIATGYSDNLFGTGDNVTRQDMVTLIYRAAQYKGIALEVKEIGFTDEADIADYAKDAVGALSNAEIVNGLDLYTFGPKEFATRAQVAKIVYKLVVLQ